MTFIIYNIQKIIDTINNIAADFLTERWYNKILEEIAEEYKQDMLKKMKKL